MFGNRKEKAAKEAAAQVELDRLRALPLPQFAAQVMRAFGPDGLQTRSGHQQGAVQISTWLMSDYSKSVKFTQPLMAPVIEALQLLASRGLVDRRGFGSGSASTYHATRLGESALAGGSLLTHL